MSSFTPAVVLLSSRVQSLRSLTLSLSETGALPGSVLSSRFFSLFHALLYGEQPPDFPSLLISLFSLHFAAHHRLVSHTARPGDDSRRSALLSLCEHLHAMQLLSPSSPLSSLLRSSLILPVITRHIAATCGSLSESHLQALSAFTRDVVAPFAALLLQPAVSSSSSSALSSSPSSANSSPLMSHAYHAYAQHLISQLFDAVVAYPASLPALRDLHWLLPLTRLHSLLLSSLSSSLHRRLLHPGASTPDILLTLVSAMRSLRVVEDEGVLGVAVCAVIGDYVRGRTDCVRCVMRMVVGNDKKGADEGAADGQKDAREAEPADGEGGDGELDLSDELEREPERDHGDDSDAEDAMQPSNSSPAPSASPPPASSLQHPFSAHPPSASLPPPVHALESWTPDPLSAHPTITSRKGRHGDLLTFLFSLSPPASSSPAAASSLSPFRDEYRLLLARRLLSRSGYSRDDDVVRNERLKARWGEEELAECEVMVRDIENSKRTVARIGKEIAASAEQQQTQPLTPHWTLYVLSHEYWPAALLAFCPAAFSPPAPFALLHSLSSLHYSALHKPRTLTFLPALGSVDLSVHLEDRTVRTRCDPLAASVLAVWEKGGERDVREVMAALGLEEAAEEAEAEVRTRIVWWMGQSVLREVKAADGAAAAEGAGRYEVMETLSSEDVYDGEADGHEDEREEAAASSGVDVLSVDTYIVSMLTTFTELSCDRLHLYLQRFGVTSEFNYSASWSEMQLQDHLHHMEQRGQLKQRDGLYRINRTT